MDSEKRVVESALHLSVIEQINMYRRMFRVECNVKFKGKGNSIVQKNLSITSRQLESHNII